MVQFNPYLENKGIHIFLRGISPKVNVIMRREFKLAYFEAVVQHFNHKATETSSYLDRNTWYNMRENYFY